MYLLYASKEVLIFIINFAMCQQRWWTSFKGTLKQAFGLHPVDAASGLTRQTQDDFERYVRSSTCMTVGEIGFDYTRV